MKPKLLTVRKAVEKALIQFLHDEPDSDFQRGYLAALLTIARDDLGEDFLTYPYLEAAQVLRDTRRR